MPRSRRPGWSGDETDKLLEIFAEVKQSFCFSGTRSDSPGFDLVTERFAEAGYDRSGKQVRDKLAIMRRTYKTIRDKVLGPGGIRNLTPSERAFKDQMDPVYADMPILSPMNSPTGFGHGGSPYLTVTTGSDSGYFGTNGFSDDFGDGGFENGDPVGGASSGANLQDCRMLDNGSGLRSWDGEMAALEYNHQSAVDQDDRPATDSHDDNGAADNPVPLHNERVEEAPAEMEESKFCVANDIPTDELPVQVSYGSYSSTSSTGEPPAGVPNIRRKRSHAAALLEGGSSWDTPRGLLPKGGRGKAAKREEDQLQILETAAVAIQEFTRVYEAVETKRLKQEGARMAMQSQLELKRMHHELAMERERGRQQVELVRVLAGILGGARVLGDVAAGNATGLAGLLGGTSGNVAAANGTGVAGLLRGTSGNVAAANATGLVGLLGGTSGNVAAANGTGVAGLLGGARDGDVAAVNGTGAPPTATTMTTTNGGPPAHESGNVKNGKKCSFTHSANLVPPRCYSRNCSGTSKASTSSAATAALAAAGSMPAAAVLGKLRKVRTIKPCEIQLVRIPPESNPEHVPVPNPDEASVASPGGDGEVIVDQGQAVVNIINEPSEVPPGC